MFSVTVFLLAVGGATLLCALGCLAICAVFVSCFLTACYISVSCIHNLYYGKRYLDFKNFYLFISGSFKISHNCVSYMENVFFFSMVISLL